uniref:Chitin-binding type-2 domain-containing protein n=2 Tax=Stomoxys calcitrans TaxID=35570 RepID=A0A1I8QD16_STOCA
MNKVLLAVLMLSVSLGSLEAVDICKNQPNGVLLPYPEDCTKYVVCRQGEPHMLLKCPLGLHFNRLQSICDVKERAACQLEKSQVSQPVLAPLTGPSGTTCLNSGKCAGMPDGTMFADPNSSGYIVCQCECEIAMPCAPGTAFNEALQTCAH